jgi:hypothetical protein
MAKYTVTRACGHDEIINLIGKQCDWRLENVEPSKLCYECYQKQLAEQHEKENREAAEVAKEMNLPELTGSEKQVAWAETIRQQMLAGIDNFVYHYIKDEHRNDLKIQEPIQSIRAKTSASWWIDHRGDTKSPSYVKRLLEAEYGALKKEQAQAPKNIVDTAKIEATVRPENPKTETIAEISALENAIKISFPEKRDDFREIVKGMGFKWDNGHWRRKLFIKNGTPADRAAEAGHKLLAAGFIIRIYDEDIRARAISGEYEQECTSWVQLRTGEKYTGWLAINWSRKDDFYRAAKRIAGARYSKPSVVVPVENYEEVLDFAQMYGFRVSQAAQEAIDMARQVKEASLTAKIEPPKEPGRVVAGDKPPVLEVPVEVGIADEFKD